MEYEDKHRQLHLRLQDQGLDPQVADSLAEVVWLSAQGDMDPERLAQRVLEPWLLAQASARQQIEQRRWVDWPSPQAWYERSHAALRDCRPLQLLALTILAPLASSIGLGGVGAPPTRPDDLEKQHFVPWRALAQCLQEVEDYETAGGRAEVLSYQKPDGGTDALVFYSDAAIDGTGGRPSTLHRLKELAEQVAGETGLRPDQSMAFLLCNAPVRVARISFAGPKGGPRDDAVFVQLVDINVSSDELRHAYRSYQKYLRSLAKRETPSTQGFGRYLTAQPKRPLAQPSGRTLLAGAQELVAFVEPRRAAEESWEKVLEAWNANHERQVKTERNLQANFYQAKRRLKKRLPPVDEQGALDQDSGESREQHAAMPREHSALERRVLEHETGGEDE